MEKLEKRDKTFNKMVNNETQKSHSQNAYINPPGMLTGFKVKKKDYLFLCK